MSRVMLREVAVYGAGAIYVFGLYVCIPGWGEPVLAFRAAHPPTLVILRLFLLTLYTAVAALASWRVDPWASMIPLLLMPLLGYRGLSLVADFFIPTMLGCWLGYCVQQGKGTAYTLGSSAGLGAGLVGVALLFFLLAENRSPLEAFGTQVTTSLERHLDWEIAQTEAQGSGSEVEQILARLRERKAQIPESVRGLEMHLPALMIAVCAMMAGFGFWVVDKVARALWIPVFQNSAFRRFSLPPWMVWVFILAAGFFFAGEEVFGRGLYILGLSVFWLSGALYLLRGLAILNFVLVKPGMIPPLAIALSVMLFLISIHVVVHLVVTGIGLVDTWFDFRKLNAAAAEGG